MFKKMFAAILTVALILTLNASAFATEGENLDGQHDQGMTTELTFLMFTFYLKGWPFSEKYHTTSNYSYYRN